jgi:hypothetical protein
MRLNLPPQHLVLQRVHALMLGAIAVLAQPHKMVVVQRIAVLALPTSQMQCSHHHHADLKHLHDSSRHLKK